MNYSDFITEIGKKVNETKSLLVIDGRYILIEKKYFTEKDLNKFQRLLQLNSSNIEWFMMPSKNIEEGVMYQIEHLTNE